MRKLAKKNVVKKWELMKICRDVIDENEELIMKMNVKEMLKENVSWKDSDEENYSEWKLRNVRHLSLKETKFNVKENMKIGPFEKFCSKKGLIRVRDLWERKYEKDYELKESLLKELKEGRKTAKSRRKKIDLTKKCKSTIKSTITDWKSTPWKEEETLLDEIKKTAKKELKMIAIGRGEKLEENEFSKTQKHEALTSGNPGNLKPHLHLCDIRETETLLAAQPSLLPAELRGQVEEKLFTKPQHVYCGSSSEAAGGPVTSPTSQWERRAGNRDRGGRADSQWRERNKLEGKLGD